MLYSIQHSGGRVAGHFELPNACLSDDEWIERLGQELWKYLGSNTVRLSTLISGEEEIPRIVIDIDPLVAEETAIEKAHLAVGMVALLSEREDAD